jgi:E3 ubiquitin-protein transferase RMND5
MVLAKLNNRTLETSLDKMHEDLKVLHAAQASYTKAIEKRLKANIPSVDSDDALIAQSSLVDRAIAMHLLREGQFSAATTFLEEAERQSSMEKELLQHAVTDNSWQSNLASARVHSEALQQQFSEMYHILHQLRQQRNLAPARHWARQNAGPLDHRGSNLEFELCRLQFVALSMGYSLRGGPEPSEGGPVRALEFARAEFPLFQHRYSKEINQLMGSMAFFTNLGDSPYRHFFYNDTAWEDVANSFTREFCSLLGLAADSPLYIAATAGAIALPTLIKLKAIMKDKRTEWTTEDELPVDTPLPPGYQFHSIFVCPVSKEQSTETNPPMMMPCGHVICKESLERISKSSRFKCPYCPNESHFHDAKQVYL